MEAKPIWRFTFMKDTDLRMTALFRCGNKQVCYFFCGHILTVVGCIVIGTIVKWYVLVIQQGVQMASELMSNDGVEVFH